MYKCIQSKHTYCKLQVQYVPQLACSCDSGMRERTNKTWKCTLPDDHPFSSSLGTGVSLCSVYLEVPVVYCAAAVSGPRRVLTGIEQSAEFTVEAGLWHYKLHSYWSANMQQLELNPRNSTWQMRVLTKGIYSDST